MSILTEPGWDVTEGEITELAPVGIDVDRNLTGIELAEYLNTPLNDLYPGEWVPDAEGYINLHFPVRISSPDPDPEAPEILGYPFNTVETVGQVLGAIHTYFTTPLTLPELQNAAGLTSGSYQVTVDYLNQLLRKRSNPLTVTKPITVADLLPGTYFDGLEPLEQRGHYRVDLSE